MAFKAVLSMWNDAKFFLESTGKHTERKSNGNLDAN